MPKYLSLGYIAVACLANALQVPGHWDIFDIGATIMGLCGLAVAIWGD